MGGATLLCGAFEGEDKSASPIVSVLDEAFVAAFGVPRRGRWSLRIARLLGRKVSPEQALVEASILEIMHSEEGGFSSRVAQLLLPHLRSYRDRLLDRYQVRDTIDDITGMLASGTAAKYGKRFDPGWHLYCLHDLVLACEMSVRTGEPIQIVWS